MRKGVKTRKCLTDASATLQNIGLCVCVLHKEILTPNENKVGSAANAVLTVLAKRVNASLTYSHTRTENQSEKDMKQSSFMHQT